MIAFVRDVTRAAVRSGSIRRCTRSQSTSAGVAPARITIIGDVAEKSASRPARGKKAGAAPAADRVELEIEPE